MNANQRRALMRGTLKARHNEVVVILGRLMMHDETMDTDLMSNAEYLLLIYMQQTGLCRWSSVSQGSGVVTDKGRALFLKGLR